MNQSDKSKVWSAVALALVYLSIDFLFITQGSHLELPSPIDIGKTLADDRATDRYGASMYGLIALLPTYLFYTYICKKAVKKSSYWQFRYPNLFDLSLSPSESFDRKLQAVAVVLAFIAPLYVSGHLGLKYLKGRALVDAKTYEHFERKDLLTCVRTTPNKLCIVAEEPLQHLFGVSPRLLFTKRGDRVVQYSTKCAEHLDDPGTKSQKCDGIDYLPFWQPWFIVISVLITIVFSIYVHWKILLVSSEKKP